MVRCWKCSETGRLEDSQRVDNGPAVSYQFPHKAFWVTLSATLLLVIIALSVTGHLWLRQPDEESLQVVRITVPDQTGTLINRSALVDKHNNLVTYSVTSQANHTSTVLFDVKHGSICYKPENRDTCFLRKMERSDYENVHSLLQQSTQQVGIAVRLRPAQWPLCLGTTGFVKASLYWRKRRNYGWLVR
ncbi:BRICHOS domain-containing protein 5-like [Salmo trutta]|uniref:BRICHOS domain-containing protein 5-like n=1 Tax=Salmo trutta TaxID=8032 RepID=UPI0011301CA6|nr:BRICHOS domain-containing protein 5-like [Salmo trutta]